MKYFTLFWAVFCLVAGIITRQSQSLLISACCFVIYGAVIVQQSIDKKWEDRR